MRHGRRDYRGIQDVGTVTTPFYCSQKDCEGHINGEPIDGGTIISYRCSDCGHEVGRGNILPRPGGIPMSMPVFLLLGKDIAAAATVRFWCDEALAKGANPKGIEQVRRWAELMASWPVKEIPDAPEEAEEEKAPRVLS